MNGKNMLRYTSRELQDMCARGESRTDWERLYHEQEAGMEPDMSDPDDAEVSDEAFAATLAKRRPNPSPIKFRSETRGLDVGILGTVP